MRTLRRKCIYKLQTRHLASRSIWYRIRQHVLPLLAQIEPPESIAMQWIRAVLYMIHSSRIPTVAVFVVMYYYHPRLLAKSNIEKQYFSHSVNDVCNGSPSRMRRVLLISFGMTILPRSSTRRTMPVAFIILFSFEARDARFAPVEVFAGKGELCMGAAAIFFSGCVSFNSKATWQGSP